MIAKKEHKRRPHQETPAPRVGIDCAATDCNSILSYVCTPELADIGRDLGPGVEASPFHVVCHGNAGQCENLITTGLLATPRLECYVPDGRESWGGGGA
jgi:hypothetical protein